ncbi:transposase (plasmid) [Polymorphobacter sp. PAMC 29334]|uniref:transposase n=1 Tax=Polymorphobacter sp. PAMC 29334 TaxID=2862331 RepID=UPI001C67B4CA|nr:transposase [Polymorphobacter sp. PAMC 29334]
MRQRSWSDYEKGLIVAESYASDGITVCDVERRNGIGPSQLFTWRRNCAVRWRPPNLYCLCRRSSSLKTFRRHYPHSGGSVADQLAAVAVRRRSRSAWMAFRCGSAAGRSDPDGCGSGCAEGQPVTGRGPC